MFLSTLQTEVIGCGLARQSTERKSRAPIL